MPSDLDRAVKASKSLEAALKKRHRATGKGLHELVSSVEPHLPADAVRDLRYIATIRNKLVHEDGYDRIDDRREFAHRLARARKAVGDRSGPSPAVVAVVASGVVVVLVSVALLLRLR